MLTTAGVRGGWVRPVASSGRPDRRPRESAHSGPRARPARIDTAGQSPRAPPLAGKFRVVYFAEIAAELQFLLLEPGEIQSAAEGDPQHPSASDIPHARAPSEERLRRQRLQPRLVVSDDPRRRRPTSPCRAGFRRESRNSSSRRCRATSPPASSSTEPSIARRVLRHNLMFRPTGAGNGLGLRSQEWSYASRLEPPDEGSGPDVAAIREVAADAQFGAADDESAADGEMPGIVARAEDHVLRADGCSGHCVRRIEPCRQPEARASSACSATDARIQGASRRRYQQRTRPRASSSGSSVAGLKKTSTNRSVSREYLDMAVVHSHDRRCAYSERGACGGDVRHLECAFTRVSREARSLVARPTKSNDVPRR